MDVRCTFVRRGPRGARRRGLAPLAALALVVATPTTSFAVDPPPPEPRAPDLPNDATPRQRVEGRMIEVARAGEEPMGKHEGLVRLIDRPHTVAELEGGILALPTAPISPGQRGGDAPIVGRIGRGDATLLMGLHFLYRWNRSFAVGAGALFAPRPTSDSEYGGLGGLARTHSRSYLFLGVEGRYIPIHYKFSEVWLGASVGGVVIADRFTTEAAPDVPSILGKKEVTVRTEGVAVGLQAGGNYYLSENWIAGLHVRGSEWFLPERPECSPIGDCPTLTNDVLAIEVGLTMGYRLPL